VALKRERLAAMLPDSTDNVLERYRAYLECLTHIQVDPRLWRRFGWSDVINHTLLEAFRDLEQLQNLDEADRNRRLRRMLMNNLLERIEHERAQARDYRREIALDVALDESSCNLRQALVADSAGPDANAVAAERGALLTEALASLPERERTVLILQRFHNWTLARVAEHLACTIGTVAGLHARGLKRLQERLSQADSRS
jgi:RNA polymerase sigma-70 factor, ECF subfamily